MNLIVAPLFRFDCIRLARRWQTYAARVLVLACLLGSMIAVWWLEERRAESIASNPFNVTLVVTPTGAIRAVSTISTPRPMFAIFDPAHFATQMFVWLTTAQMILVIVLVPAITAGSVSGEKRTLAELLASGVSGPAIVLSKLAARLLWIVTLMGCPVSVLYLTALLGGIEPDAILAAALITLSAAIFACALALAVSVEAAQTHEALVMTYFILVMLWFVPLLPWIKEGWIRPIAPGSFEDQLALWNPFLAAFLPYLRWSGFVPWSDQLGFVGRALALSAIAVIWAAARINRVVMRQADRPIRRETRWSRWRAIFLRPVLEINPVMWREWRRRSQSKMGRFLGFIYVVCAMGITIGLVLHKVGLWYRGPAGVLQFASMAWALLCCALGGGLLLLCILSVVGLAEDREGGGFEILLTTPMSTRSILWGKWWGACRLVPLVLLTPIAVVLAGNWEFGSFHVILATVFVAAVSMVYAAAFVTLGLAMAVWIPQTGRAVAISVGVLVFSWLAGWAMAQVLPTEFVLGASSLSGWPSVVETFEHHSWADTLFEVLPWMFVYGTVTAILFFLIDMTIYWCVGRMRAASAAEPWE
jgi:ABC-type transport system involved in multi-copper enzyme maturation permease subunit